MRVEANCRLRAIPSRSRAAAILFIGLISSLSSTALRSQTPPPSASTEPLTSLVFCAEWTDGQRDSGELTGWDQPDGKLGYRNQPLFMADKSVRWLRSTRPMRDSPISSGVEFIGGDFLPGDVLGLNSAAEQSVSASDLIWLAPAASADLPGTPQRSAIPIRQESIWRIVWQPTAGGSFQPGTLVLRDGRVLRFRALHWTVGGVRLLEESDVKTLRIEEIAELHLTHVEPWPAHLRQLALLSPDCRGKLVQLEIAGGGRLTTSLDRVRPWSIGETRGAAGSFLIVQPPWTTDGIAVPIESIERITLFSSDEMPLTWLTPSRSEHQGTLFVSSVVGPGPSVVQSKTLFSGNLEHAWGLGVHAQHVLEFSLPQETRRVQTWVGLDKAAANHGCARGRIEITPAPRGSSAATQESPLIIGSAQRPARLECRWNGAPSRDSRLRLIADPAINDRPPDADPFEICDYVDWLEPLIIFDHEQLSRTVRRQLEQSLPALAGWTCDGELRLASQWRPGGRPLPGFRNELVMDAQPLILSQKAEVTDSRSHLFVFANQLPGRSAAVELRIRIDGNQIVRRKLPLDDFAGQTPPIIVDLTHYIGGTALIDLEFRSLGPDAKFELLGAKLAADKPLPP
jgi:hypothetical protein